MEISVGFAVYEKGKRAPEYTIDTDHDGKLTQAELLRFLKNSLIVIADTALREEQAKGFDKNPVVAVDGKIGKPVIEVSPIGKIDFTARAASKDVIQEVFDYVVERSPVDTGLYKKSHVVFLNGTIVATDPVSLKSWLSTNPKIQDRDILRIVNITPYGRKLERYGVTASRKRLRAQKSKDKKQRSGVILPGDKKKSILAPNGVYYLATKSALKKYRRNVVLKFEFVPGGRIGNLPTMTNPRTGTPLLRNYKKTGAPYLYPSIKIVFGGGTV